MSHQKFERSHPLSSTSPETVTSSSRLALVRGRTDTDWQIARKERMENLKWKLLKSVGNGFVLGMTACLPSNPVSCLHIWEQVEQNRISPNISLFKIPQMGSNDWTCNSSLFSRAVWHRLGLSFIRIISRLETCNEDCWDKMQTIRKDFWCQGNKVLKHIETDWKSCFGLRLSSHGHAPAALASGKARWSDAAGRAAELSVGELAWWDGEDNEWMEIATEDHVRAMPNFSQHLRRRIAFPTPRSHGSRCHSVY